MSISEAVRAWLLEPALAELKKMEAKMGALADAVTQLKQDIVDETTVIDKANGDILQAIKDLQNGPQSAEVTQAIADLKDASATIKGSTQKLTDLDTSAIAADPGATPPTP